MFYEFIQWLWSLGICSLLQDEELLAYRQATTCLGRVGTGGVWTSQGDGPRWLFSRVKGRWERWGRGVWLSGEATMERMGWGARKWRKSKENLQGPQGGQAARGGSSVLLGSPARGSVLLVMLQFRPWPSHLGAKEPRCIGGLCSSVFPGCEIWYLSLCPQLEATADGTTSLQVAGTVGLMIVSIEATWLPRKSE